MDEATQSEKPGRGNGLNELLNVLWRWRFFLVAGPLLGLLAGFLYGQVVTPLYRASATVQPGITHFNDRGQPVREWRVRDIVQWYRRGDFNPAVAGLLSEDPATTSPLILATHLPRSPQQQGGLTINLSTLDPSPEHGREILAASIQAFNQFAQGDSATSQLMHVRIATNIEKQSDKIESVVTKQKLVELEIEAALRERQNLSERRSGLQAELSQLNSSAELLRGTREAYRQMIVSGRQGLGELKGSLGDWEEQTTQLRGVRDSLATRGGDTTSLLLYGSQIADLAAEVGRLRDGIFDQEKALLSWQDRVRQLQMDEARLTETIELKRYENASDLPAQMDALERSTRELALQRDEDLPREAEEHRQELLNMQARLASLQPLEEMGAPVATARPVRPRTRRAMILLMFAGLAASLVGSFALDYLARNWRDITRASNA